MTTPNVLIVSAYPPGVHQHSIERALRQLGHQVFTAGASRPLRADYEQALRAWDPEYRHGAVLPVDASLDSVLAACPFRPDVMLWIEAGIPCLPERLGEAPCPVVGLFSEDTIHADFYGALFPYFDLAVCTWKATEKAWRAQGHDNVRQWYFGARPEFCVDEGLERIWDVAFLGNLNPRVQRRRLPTIQKILRLRDEGLRVLVGANIFFRDYSRALGQARIVYHRGITDQVNMRVFEAMGAGCLVVMQRPVDPEDPTTHFFRDREDVVFADSDEEALDLIRYYAAHEDERRRIAEAGRQTVLARHSYTDVVRQFITEVVPAIPARLDDARRARLARHGKDARRQRLDYARYFTKFNALDEAQTQLRGLGRFQDDPEALNGLGVVYGLGQQPDTAATLLAHACARAPEAVLARLNLAALGLSAGRSEADRWCEEAFRALEAADPATLPPAAVEGACHAGSYDRFGLEVAHTYLRHGPGPERTAALIRLYRYHLHQQLGRRRLDEERFADALPHLDAALALVPDDGYLVHDRVRALVGLGQRPAAAVDELRRATALEPFFSAAQHALGGALEDAGRPQEALAVYYDLVAHNPLFEAPPDLRARIDELAALTAACPRVSIVIPAGEGRLAQRALASLHEHTAPDDLAEIILIKRGGGRALDAFLSLVDAPLTVLPGSASLPADLARAAEAATGSHLVFLDQGVAVQPDWLPALLAAAGDGIAAARLTDPSGATYPAPEACFGLSRALWQTVGGVDAAAAWPDAFAGLVRRAEACGFPLQIAEACHGVVPTSAPAVAAGRPRASIIVLAWNQLEYTRECVESVLACTEGPFELILVDNGSSDGTLDYFRTVAGATVVANPTNLGFAAGNNRGIEVATGEYVIILNNDTLVTETWLDGLIACAEEDPTIGIVGPVSNSVSGPQQVDGASYESFQDLQAYARAFREQHRGRRLPLDRIVGFCMLIRREVIEKIGVLDERFGLGNFEDDDYCLRTRQAGFRLMVAQDVFIHHFGSRTFLGNGVDFAAAMQHGQEAFLAKWNGAANGHGGSADDWVARGQGHLEAGRVEDAARDFQHALALVPNHPQAQQGLVVASHQAHPPQAPADVAGVTDAFHRAWYDTGAWMGIEWFGLPIRKNPFDLLQYQEIITTQRPDFVIECGAFVGGSTLYFAHLLDLLGHGRVISIELAGSWHPLVVKHPRVVALTGSSTAPETLARVRGLVPAGARCFVILDSDHRAEHVLAELRAYQGFVHAGGYLIAEDSNINGHPVLPGWGPGPWEAAQAFLAEHPHFAPDRERERKLLMTFAPSGWLRRLR